MVEGFAGKSSADAGTIKMKSARKNPARNLLIAKRYSIRQFVLVAGTVWKKFLQLPAAHPDSFAQALCKITGGELFLHGFFDHLPEVNRHYVVDPGIADHSELMRFY